MCVHSVCVYTNNFTISLLFFNKHYFLCYFYKSDCCHLIHCLTIHSLSNRAMAKRRKAKQRAWYVPVTRRSYQVCDVFTCVGEEWRDLDSKPGSTIQLRSEQAT